jgi:hypothetical protein
VTPALPGLVGNDVRMAVRRPSEGRMVGLQYWPSSSYLGGQDCFPRPAALMMLAIFRFNGTRRRVPAPAVSDLTWQMATAGLNLAYSTRGPDYAPPLKPLFSLSLSNYAPVCQSPEARVGHQIRPWIQVWNAPPALIYTRLYPRQAKYMPRMTEVSMKYTILPLQGRSEGIPSKGFRSGKTGHLTNYMVSALMAHTTTITT